MTTVKNTVYSGFILIGVYWCLVLSTFIAKVTHWLMMQPILDILWINFVVSFIIYAIVATVNAYKEG